jgi:hypothetical protein
VNQDQSSRFSDAAFRASSALFGRPVHIGGIRYIGLVSREVSVESGPGGFEFRGARLVQVETSENIEPKALVEIEGAKYRVVKAQRLGRRVSLTIEGIER